jgi:hypothetical protein
MRLHRSVFAILVFFSVTTGAFGARQERLFDGWRPVHYSIDITLDDQLTAVTSARAEITILIVKDRMAVIDLDFGEMTVTSVSVNSNPVIFDRAAGRSCERIRFAGDHAACANLQVGKGGLPPLRFVANQL